MVTIQLGYLAVRGAAVGCAEDVGRARFGAGANFICKCVGCDHNGVAGNCDGSAETFISSGIGCRQLDLCVRIPVVGSRLRSTAVNSRFSAGFFCGGSKEVFSSAAATAARDAARFRRPMIRQISSALSSPVASSALRVAPSEGCMGLRVLKPVQFD